MSFAGNHARHNGRIRRRHQLRSAVVETLEPRRLLTGAIPTLINTFEGTVGPFSASPYSGLTLYDGTLYGNTYQGGIANDGLVYSLKPGDTSASFNQDPTVAKFDGANGSDPKDALTAVGNLLYCATENGIISKFNPANDTLVAAGYLPGHSDLPDNTMVNVGGMLYGDTTAGGAHNTGYLYQFNPTTTAVTTLVSFAGGKPGVGAANTTLLDLNGSLYGTVEGNGAHGDGYIFKYNLSTKNFTTLFSFDGANGSAPQCGLIDVNGYLYGTTSAGGSKDGGTLFKLNLTNNTLATLVNFVSTPGGFLGISPIGGIPVGTLTYHNGLVYGTCTVGGSNDSGGGTVWDYNPSTSNFAVIGYVSIEDGTSPNGNVVFVNNVLYETDNGANDGVGGMVFALYPPTTIQMAPALHNLTIRIDPSNGADLEVLSGAAKYADYPFETLSALNIVGDASITNTVKVDYSGGFFYQPVSFQGAGSHNSLSIVDGPNIETSNELTTTWTFGTGSATMSLAGPFGDGNYYDPTVNYNAVQTVSLLARGSGGEDFVFQSPAAPGETLPTSTRLDVTNNDMVYLQSTDSPISIFGAGSDTNNFDEVLIGSKAPSLGGTLGNILAAITVNNVSQLTADDSGDHANTTGALSLSSITGFGMPSTASISYTSVDKLQLHGGAGTNVETISGNGSATTLYAGNQTQTTVNVNATASPLTIYGSGHVDLIHIGNGITSKITAPITITDTNKTTSTLTVDDSSDTANRSGLFSSTSITGFGMGTAGAISYIGGQLASVSVHGGSGTNSDTITGTSAATSLYPGTSKLVVSTVAVRATTAPLTINGDGNADFITIGSLAPSLGGTLTAITGAITVTNTSNPSTLTLDDSGDTTHRTGTLTPTTITGLGMASSAKVTYTGSGLHLLTLRGNKGNAKLTETGTSCPVSLINITKV